ncbi:MAG: hydrogenase nickel incorporation protein HypB [Dongiaceae bacterium]
MCSVCGCGSGKAHVAGRSGHRHDHDHGHDHDHHHGHDHSHDHAGDHHHHDHDGTSHVQHHAGGDLHFGQGAAGVHVGGVSQVRLMRIEQDILSKNQGFAEENRARLAASRMLALNLISSPGAGKTTLLVATINALKSRLAVAVIEGDQETSNDADRIRATGAPAIQINTGRGCHLDAHMVGHALDDLPIAGGLLFIENVGNLVCPAGFDLGEACKVVILSVTEGDDKPLKYPDAFAAADLVILSKIDLLPYVDFDIARCIGHARAIHPEIAVIQLSARAGEGMADWLAWIEAAMAAVPRQAALVRARADAPTAVA